MKEKLKNTKKQQFWLRRICEELMGSTSVFQQAWVNLTYEQSSSYGYEESSSYGLECSTWKKIYSKNYSIWICNIANAQGIGNMNALLLKRKAKFSGKAQEKPFDCPCCFFCPGVTPNSGSFPSMCACLERRKWQ